ncbi:MAG: hypothetical protein JW767_09570 [Thermoleophilia bacterium]|nr:hypothetical protein [Thermoleophilia bacterium]
MHYCRSVVAFVLTLALFIGIAAAVAACDSSDEGNGGTDGDAAVSTTTYRNDEFGFSITYPERYVQSDPVTSGGAGGSAEFSVAFVDPDGTEIGGLAVDGVYVAVYDLGIEFMADEVADLEVEFVSLVDELVGGLENGTVTAPVVPVEINGTPGFDVNYTYTNEGTEMQAWSMFLVKGKYEYMITSQVASDRFDEMLPELEAAAMSFTIE